MSELQKIVILKLNDKRDLYTTLPDNMRAETSKKIGSQFHQNTRDCIRGLSPEQERVYLPNYLGVQPSDAQFPLRAREFWSDFTITPTVKGIRLNVMTTRGKAMVGDKEIEIDIPVNVDDYMMYQFCLKSDKVATSDMDLSNLGMFDFYIEDLAKVQEKELNEFEIIDRADTTYVKLTLDSKIEANMDKINHILELTKEKGTYFDVDLNTTEKKMLLRKLKQDRPALFVSIAEDENLEHKALLNKMLTYLIVTKEGNDIYYGSENMGSHDKAAINYLKEPTKSTSVLAMKSKLQEAVSNKKEKEKQF